MSSPEDACRLSRHWDIKNVRKKHMVMPGRMGPSFGGRVMKKTKRVSIEIHGQEDPKKKKEPTTTTLAAAVQDNDRVLIRLLKPRKSTWGTHHEEDGDSEEEDGEMVVGEDEHTNDDWVEHRKYDLEDISDLTIDDKTVTATVGKGTQTEVRDFIFDTHDQANDFYTEIKSMQQVGADRASRRIAEFEEKRGGGDDDDDPLPVAEHEEPQPKRRSRALMDHIGVQMHKSSTKIDPNADIHLLVEIVSASDLPVMDLRYADPFVTVWLGKKEIHKTAYIPNTLDPIWTVENGSLFSMTCTAEEFFRATRGLVFEVSDYDAANKNDLIGRVAISHEELMEANGERVEKKLELDPSVHKTGMFSPKLMLRCRKAGKEDVKFLQDFEAMKRGKKMGVYADATFVGPKAHSVQRLKRETRPGDGGLQYRVKPGPDPARDEQATKWLTERQIEAEAHKPSTSWIECGSGDLGRLYFEIIGCDGLPNLDVSLGTRDKTDAFCSIIFEDAIVNSDVINDCLSPRWMPWSQRAFVFHVAHISSQLLVGVFDYDNLAVNAHDPVGRVSIDFTNFRPNTVYLLHYDLHRSSLDDDRKPCGKLTVRLRLEADINIRGALKTSMKLPPQNYINVAKKNDFKNAHFVCNGEEDMNKLDIEAIKSYAQELRDYQRVIVYILDAVKTVLLWRGHYEVSIWKCKIKLPLHSMVAFLLSVCLVENFNLFPSFLLFSITWLLFATNEERNRNPSPWTGVFTIGEMWFALVTGKLWKEKIVSEENKPLIEKYQAARTERMKAISEQIEKQKEATEKMNSYFKAEEEETAGDEAETDITTKTEKFSINPLKPVLMPIQKLLGSVCVMIRIVRSIITWDESFYAFIIANGCLIAGIAIIWVPWGWIIRWTLRICVWVILGPWFGYTVDFCVVRKLERQSITPMMKKKEERHETSMKERGAALLLRKKQAAIKKENALKLKAVKRYMFGKYIVRVPRFKEYRWADVPLSESTATPVEPGYNGVVITETKHGQHLVGDMIPIWGDAKNPSITSAVAKKESMVGHVRRNVTDKVLSPGYGAVETVTKPLVGVASKVTKPVVGSITSVGHKAIDRVNPMKKFRKSHK